MIREIHGAIVLFCLFAGCASMPGSSHDSMLQIPQSVRSALSNVSSKEVAYKTGAITDSTYRLTSFSQDKDSPEFTSGLVAIDSIDGPSTSSSLYENRASFGPSSIDLDTLLYQPEKQAVWERLVGDQLNFYSKESVLGLGFFFGTGALIANTSADVQLQNHFQSSVRGASSDEWFEFLHSNKELGNGVYTLPVFGAAWMAKEVINGPPMFETVGLWGERSMRGFLVGAPPLVLMQAVTGGSRPHESTGGSQWNSFSDNNGVSGHAFMSSLPFITAAKLSENPWQKTFWYTASAIGPLSRVNDNAHYPSQVGLGWAMAYIAATAVHQTDTGKRGWTLAPQSSVTSSGFALQYLW